MTETLLRAQHYSDIDVELGLLFCGSGPRTATASSGRCHGGCAHAKFLFDGFHQVVEFHDRHAVQRGQKSIFIECHLCFPNNWFLRHALRRQRVSGCLPREPLHLRRAFGDAASTRGCAGNGRLHATQQ
jgi:hypothetical protein